MLLINHLFFIRPFHANKEDKVILDKEMKQLCYLGIVKEGFSACSSPEMLISRKVTQDKELLQTLDILTCISQRTI